MNVRFLKDHLIDFEVAAALCIVPLLRYGFGTGWLVAIVSGLSAFVLIPLLLLLVFGVRAGRR
jgi:hypothetical protein